MTVSYEGIGAWSATCTTENAVEGQVVKIGGNGAAAKCSSGDAFCGVAGPVRGGVCAVQLGGLAEVCYSGETAPTAGVQVLTADGNGGVCVAGEGASYWVLSVDTAAGTCVIKL